MIKYLRHAKGIHSITVTLERRVYLILLAYMNGDITADELGEAI